jgi:hypothetical protein
MAKKMKKAPKRLTRNVARAQAKAGRAARKPTNHGGHRAGSGRPSMFPGKRQRLTLHTSPEVRAALLRRAAELTERRGETTTLADAAEFDIRVQHGLPVPENSMPMTAPTTPAEFGEQFERSGQVQP